MIGGTNKAAIALGVAIAGAALGSSFSASAADLGGNCCADLEERIAELEATTARKGNRKVSLTVSGYINEQVMWWDDGGESNVYQGTNGSDPSRFRFLGKGKITDDFSAGYLLEIGVWSERQDQFSQTSDDTAAGNTLQTRHAAWYIESKTFGKLTMGQTSTPQDGITELTLAKTITVEKPITIFTPNGGFALRADGNIAGNSTWGNLTPVSGPGEGDRFNIVRYDTPVIAGFTGSAAWGEDDLWNIALQASSVASSWQPGSATASTPTHLALSAPTVRVVRATRPACRSASCMMRLACSRPLLTAKPRVSTTKSTTTGTSRLVSSASGFRSAKRHCTASTSRVTSAQQPAVASTATISPDRT